MNEIMERTPNLIATEINSIKEQTRKMVLFNSIEIGRRLVEAKSMVEHGEWGNWLEKSVNYSKSTANNLMRIFEEYGSNQTALFDNNSNSQALGNLSYTQAVALFGIPQEEREEFVKTNDIENMSTRELQQAIKEKQELEQKLKDAEEATEKERQERQRISDNYDSLLKANKEHHEKAEQLKKELEEAKASGNDESINDLEISLGNAELELEKSQKRIEELEQQLKEKPIEIPATTVVEKVPEETERELVEMREKIKQLETKGGQESSKAVLKFGVLFESVVSGFRELLGTLEEIRNTDTESYEKYNQSVKGLLGKMSERL